MSGLSRRLWPFVLAVVLVTLMGAVVQTQFNLAMIEALGAPVPFGIRLQATGHDLLGFSPIFAVLVALGFALALPLATALSRVWPPAHWLIFAVAGALAVWAAMSAANAVLPMPTFIGANRSAIGTLGLMLCGGLGGLLYDNLCCRRNASGQGVANA